MLAKAKCWNCTGHQNHGLVKHHVLHNGKGNLVCMRVNNRLKAVNVVMSEVAIVRTRTFSTVQQVSITALAIFMYCWNQQAHFAPPTADVFMYFQSITVFASWDLVRLCHYGTIQHVLRTGARLFPVVRVWKFPLCTTALSQCCCSTAGQDTHSFPSSLKRGGGTSSLLPSLHPPTTGTQRGPCP